jgi:ribonuclease D
MKVIQHASFEREVLGRYGLAIEPVIDTRDVSRRVRGDGVDGGHSSRAICEREFQREIDKAEQAGDWSQRPLTHSQVAYAVLDAEVLLLLHDHFHLMASGRSA